MTGMQRLALHMFIVAIADQCVGVFIVPTLVARGLTPAAISGFLSSILGLRFLGAAVLVTLPALKRPIVIPLWCGSIGLAAFYLLFSFSSKLELLSWSLRLLMAVSLPLYTISFDTFGSAEAASGHVARRTAILQTVAAVGALAYPLLGGLVENTAPGMTYIMGSALMCVAAVPVFHLPFNRRQEVPGVERWLAQLSVGRGACEGALVFCFGSAWQIIMFSGAQSQFSVLGLWLGLANLAALLTPIVLAHSMIDKKNLMIVVALYALLAFLVSLAQAFWSSSASLIPIISLVGSVVGAAGNLLIYSRIYGSLGVTRAPHLYAGFVELGRGMGGVSFCALGFLSLSSGLSVQWLCLGSTLPLLVQVFLIWPRQRLP